MTAELRDPTSIIGRCLQGARLLYCATLIHNHTCTYLFEFIQTSICNGNVFVMKIHTNMYKTDFQEIRGQIYLSGLSSRRAVTSSFQPPSRRARQATS